MATTHREVMARRREQQYGESGCRFSVIAATPKVMQTYRGRTHEQKLFRGIANQEWRIIWHPDLPTMARR
jgi:hypothetical protein